MNMPLDPEARKARARAKTLRVDEAVKPNPHTKAEAAGTKVPETERMRKKRNFETMVKDVQDGRRQLPKPLDPRSEIASRMRQRGLKNDIEDTGVKRTQNGVFDLWDERDQELQQNQAHVDEFGYEEDWWQPMTKKPKLYSEEKTADAIRPSGRKAIEIAHEGSSYNPEYDAHQELLQQALVYHSKKADRRMKEAKRVPRPSKVEPLIFESDEENGAEEMEGVEEEEEKPKVNIAHIPRKTKQERKKELARKKHAANLAAIAARKRANIAWSKFGAMLEDMDEKDRIKKAKKEAQKELQEVREANKILQLSRHRYVHPEPEVLFTDEITGSYRTLKPKSSLIEDRFSSLQRRNMIEVRHKAAKRPGAERKTFTRYAFRDEVPM
jgi:nucleolar protein 53